MPKRGDLILNPLDARCPILERWRSELEREARRPPPIAAAFLPEKEYEKAFFHRWTAADPWPICFKPQAAA